MMELHKLLDHEVDIHIQRLAKRLMDPKTVLKWHPRHNSCQQFVDTLLDGQDFEHLSPLFPKEFVTDEGVRQTPGFAWPRYLISFNDHIDGLSTLSSQPKSIISKYCQATRDRCDIVEFAELTLLKEKRELKKLVRTRKGAVKQFAKETFKMAPKFVVMAAPIGLLAPKGLVELSIPKTVLERNVYQELLLTPCVASGEDKVEGENAMSEALLDALWDLPRDTMSILQFHLPRPSTKYSTKQNKVLERKDWIKNRLRVFRPQDLFASLAGGFGAAVIEVVSTNPTSLKRLSIPHAPIYGTAHVSDKIGFLNSPVPTYVIREGENKINEFIQIMTQKCLQRLDLECSKLANVAGMLGGRLFELFKIYFRLSTGMILELFGGGASGLLFRLGSRAFKAMEVLMEDRNGWTVLDTEGVLLAVHRQKRMRSLR
jgi:hypothetical protein